MMRLGPNSPHLKIHWYFTDFHGKVFLHFLKKFGQIWRKTLSWKFTDELSIKYLQIHKWGRWIRPIYTTRIWCWWHFVITTSYIRLFRNATYGGRWALLDLVSYIKVASKFRRHFLNVRIIRFLLKHSRLKMVAQ